MDINTIIIIVLSLLLARKFFIWADENIPYVSPKEAAEFAERKYDEWFNK